jgi:hypothetical protein
MAKYKNGQVTERDFVRLILIWIFTDKENEERLRTKCRQQAKENCCVKKCRQAL